MKGHNALNGYKRWRTVHRWRKYNMQITSGKRANKYTSIQFVIIYSIKCDTYYCTGNLHASDNSAYWNTR